jgi:predicted  nucleic acid-binding Zn-ribbon protein
MNLRRPRHELRLRGAARVSPQRGAARVSIVWMISIVVLFFVALFVAWIGFDEAAQAKDQARIAQEAAAAADARQTAEAAAVTRISTATGWYDPQYPVPHTNVEQLGASLEDLKATFSDLGKDIGTLQAALPVIKDAYNARGREIATLKDANQQLNSEKQSMETSLREAIAAKDAEITNLQKQVADAQNNAQQKQSELEQQVAAIRKQRDDLDQQIRSLRGETEEERRRFGQEKQTWEARTQAMGKSLAFLKEPEAADAEVLAVSKDLSLAWIDIGATQRLQRGTRFRVVSGRPGSKEVKAWAEVSRVEPNRAEVLISDLADRFDPVVPGDKVFNPLYDPRGDRKAVLAGRFSVPYDEGRLKTLLQRMGIELQDQLQLDTDYLIVGAEMFTDEEGNPLEEPLHPSEMPIYKDAEARGVQIVPLKDLRSYFKF